MASNEALLCKGCNKMFNSENALPLMLPCLHSFCKPCLEKSEVVLNKMICPTCGDRLPLHNGSDSAFPVNLRLLNLAKTAAIVKSVKSGNVKCQTCDDSPVNATTYLYNRSKFLCDQCMKACKKFAGENEKLVFIDLGDCKRGWNTYQARPSQCQKHHEQDIVLYCVDCRSMICVVCGQTSHSHHNKRSIVEAVDSSKATLQELTNGVDDALNTIDQTLHRTEKMRGKVKVSAKETTKKINEVCDQLIRAVEKKRKGLKERCQEIADGKDDVLSNQMVEMERLKKNLAFALYHARDAINNQHDEEVLSIRKLIEDRLIRVKKQYSSNSKDLMEDHVIETSLEVGPILNRIGNMGYFPSVPDSHKSTCSYDNGERSVQAIKGVKKKVSVTLRDEKGSLINTTRHFQYQLSKVGEDPDEYIPPKVTITQHNDGTATLGFTPDQLGEYELTIMVRNVPIANPYRITATESMNYQVFLDDPVIEHKNVGGTCYGVAVHDNGTVYATNYDGHTIKVIRPDGRESRIGSSNAAGGSLSKPRGIALIGNTIYVASYNNHSIKMYSTDGRYIKGLGTSSAGSGNGQFHNPFGICTNGKDRVYVADCSNKRIQVLSSNGTFIKIIPCSTNPYDVAIDPNGNIHAALHSNKHIAIYSAQDGQQIETYNLGGNLQRPTGIYIDSEGNRLIACGDDNMVYIGDSKSNLLAGRKINKPWAITMNDGLIYIAEYSNKHVSVY